LKIFTSKAMDLSIIENGFRVKKKRIRGRWV
jgi:hypothetical protein